MIRAFIFDIDGVIADSEDISIEVAIDYFGSIGVRATREAFREALGRGERGFFDTAAAALGLHGAPYSYEAASEFFRRNYARRIGTRSIAMPGTEIVRMARKAGIMTAAASSAPGWKTMANIAAAGLDPSDFDFIASGDDVKRCKPDKDIYALSLIKLGVAEREAVVFEDSKAGIESARKAGCRTVALMTTIDGASAYSAGADAVISDLSAAVPFSTPEEAEELLFPLQKGSGTVRYGANLIRPLERRMPDSFIEKRAVEAARKAWEHGYAPYSGFRVGAAVVSAATGRIYPGCNVENSSYGATICAERNAITTAVAAEGVIGIDLIAVYSDDDPPAPPCAVCLQVIAEFARPETRIVLASPRQAPVSYTFSELLPMPFIFPTMR